MEITGFDWDEGNQAKCLSHGVTTGDIEALFSKPLLIIDDPYDTSRERRYRAIGQSHNRFIFVVFTLLNGLIRPISARFMHKKEISRYEKDNPDLHQR